MTTFPSDSPIANDRIRLKTGRGSCVACFERTLYQLERTCSESGREVIDLGFSGSRLLERLLRTPGEVVSREELMSYAWEDRVVGQGSLNQQIYTLRHALLDTDAQIIQTLPRRGYLFNPHFVAAASDAVDERAESPATVSHIESMPIAAVEIAASVPAAQRSRWLAPMLAGTALLLTVALGTLGYRFGTSPTGSTFTHTLGVGALEVTYIEKSQSLLDRLIGETRHMMENLASGSGVSGRLIVNMSPGFYEIRCLHGDGRINWLKVHKTQLNSLPNEHLAGCLK